MNFNKYVPTEDHRLIQSMGNRVNGKDVSMQLIHDYSNDSRYGVVLTRADCEQYSLLYFTADCRIEKINPDGTKEPYGEFSTQNGVWGYRKWETAPGSTSPVLSEFITTKPSDDLNLPDWIQLELVEVMALNQYAEVVFK